MKIRKARKEDLERMVSLWWQMHTSLHGYDKDFYRRIQKKKATDSRKNQFTNALHDKNSILIVAEKEDFVVGVLTARLSDKSPGVSSRRTILVDHVIVDKEHRGMGIYSMLQERLDRIATREKVQYIELNVDVSNPAVEIYKHKGYISRQTRMVKKTKGG